MNKGIIGLGLACLFSLPLSAQAEKSKAILVLDASGSMWGQIDGKPKIEIAREVIDGLLADWNPDVELGLTAYGHRRKGDCNDIQPVVPVGPVNRQQFMGVVNSLKPVGRTPLTSAVQFAANGLKYSEDKATVILVSDGKESCDADPCALGKHLEKQGVDFTAHVIGFDVKQEDQPGLRCLAENTGGLFLSANNASELNDAMKKAVERLELPPMAEGPELSAWFEDNFDGSELTEHWKVINPNPDEFIVEDGSLVLVGKTANGLHNPQQPNIVQLQKELPKDDWEVTVLLEPELQTGADKFSIGVYNDAESFVALDFGIRTSIVESYNRWYVTLDTVKRSGGKDTRFGVRAATFGRWTGNPYPYIDDFVASLPKRFLLKLTKTGRDYVASMYLEGQDNDDGSPIWHKTEEVSMLRAPKYLVINAAQARKVDGESIFMIDSIKIEAEGTAGTAAKGPAPQ